jgi:Arc/MetJ-type ribon-helix-helix transcriptional regulator
MTTTKDDRHYTRTTPQETKWLDDLRVRHNFSSRSEAIRYCIQRTIEEESDAIGSRRYFSRTMNARIDEVIKMVEMHGETQFVALTELFSALLVLLNEGEETDATEPETMRLEVIQKAYAQSLNTKQMFRTLQRNLDVQREKLAKARRKQRHKPTTEEHATTSE